MTIRIHKDFVKQELFSPRTLVWSLLMAVLYLCLSTLLLNAKLLGDTLTGMYPLSFKLGILSSLLMGITTLYSPVEVGVLLLLGFLMGLNFILVIRSMREQQQKKGLASLGLGMVGIVASTGCASCGLTLFSVAAPTVSLSLMPFQGPLLQIISLMLLSISLIYTLNRRTNACVITTR